MVRAEQEQVASASGTLEQLRQALDTLVEDAVVARPEGRVCFVLGVDNVGTGPTGAPIADPPTPNRPRNERKPITDRPHMHSKSTPNRSQLDPNSSPN